MMTLAEISDAVEMLRDHAALLDAEAVTFDDAELTYAAERAREEASRAQKIIRSLQRQMDDVAYV